MSLTREQMLMEMGISPLWVWRDPAGGAEVAAGAATTAEPAAPEIPATHAAPASAPDAPPRPQEPAPAPLAPAVSSAWPASHPETGRPVPAGVPSAVDTPDWPELARAVAGCTACVLCQQRRQAVLGVGDLQPEWLFIGEGPGAEEDARGEPFVGQAGKLLDAMLAAIGLARGQGVYIANAVKCRPPGNRTPEAGEMAACRPWLERQIALLRPRIIVLLGKAAVHAVLGGDKPLGSLRGQRFDYAGIPVVVTYHPAYLLRNLPDKAKAWEDLLFARRTLRARPVPAEGN